MWTILLCIPFIFKRHGIVTSETMDMQRVSIHKSGRNINGGGRRKGGGGRKESGRLV